MNFIPLRDRFVWVSILEHKRLDLRHVLEVQFGRKSFEYLVERELPINLYSVLSSYGNTKYWISRSFGLGFNPGTQKVRFASCFGGSFWPQRVWVTIHKRTTYKLILCVVIILQYLILNLRPFVDGLVWVSILVFKSLDMRLVLEVQFGRKGFGYLDERG